MNEQKIKNISEFFAKAYQKNVTFFDVYDETITNETTLLCFLDPDDDNLIMIDTRRDQKDLTTVDLKQAVSQI